jgi:hypothetical protein
MGARYQHISYSEHAEENRRERNITRAAVTRILNEPEVEYPSEKDPTTIIAEGRLAARLALRIVYTVTDPGTAHVITLYPIHRRRTRI